MTSTPHFETLIDTYHDEIYGYLWRMLQNTADAQDVIQEVYARAYHAYGRLRKGSNHRAWLYKIATNCAYTALRQRRRLESQQVTYEHIYTPSPEATPEEQLIQAEHLHLVRQVIEALPAKQRAAVILRYLQGVTYAELAEALNCSEDSARANVYQGIKRLRQNLNEEE